MGILLENQAKQLAKRLEALQKSYTKAKQELESHAGESRITSDGMVNLTVQEIKARILGLYSEMDQITKQLENAKIVTNGNTKAVGIGSVVDLAVTYPGEKEPELLVVRVAETNTDPLGNTEEMIISTESALGEAVLGKGIDENGEFALPNNEKATFMVKNISSGTKTEVQENAPVYAKAR